MGSRIRQLAGVGLLGMGLSLGALAQGPGEGHGGHGPQDPNAGGGSPLNSRDEVRQTQPPRQGYYQDIPRRNGDNRQYQAGGPGQRPGDSWPGRPDGHGNGWGPGPQYRPGHAVERFPDRYWKVPYRGQDYFYSGGYWYRPNGPGYVVVRPPYGVRVNYLPSYAREVWLSGALFFLAADTYYQYQADSREYVVVNPPTTAPIQAPQATAGYDVIAYPAYGQTPQQQDQDRYQCHRWAVEQTGFDPAQASYAPPANVADNYRRAMGACLSGRGYSIN
ncbi:MULTISPECIES: DUF6515 family protein [Pseudomonas]|uniref:Uncharacterized protein n=1 Tax=Pseudomonas hunanensis TaxID=1247546 RepID=A0ACC6K0N5_9PSED|nr:MULTISPECIES: DUF6515 family protein [Pseudomonas]MBP2264380.1 hypothetical protein [Pseudomonas sp. BP8]MDR6711931.1 hypothetical protein [Pseudomonas hunanensis]HDS1737148.1 hypothetical protein [Pseudomonas putida]